MPPGLVPDRERVALADWLCARGSLLVAFSGGIDSGFLAVFARDVLGRDNVLAVLGVSPAVPADMRTRAAECARTFDVPFREVTTSELGDPDYVANRGNRCYYCKQELWRHLVPIASEAGMAAIADGTLVEDLREHRPGHAAGRAAGIASPLAACGFTKAAVRRAARERGIPFWDAPSAPCLASRVATGVQVTPSRLARIERAESSLRSLGVAGDLRVRDLGAGARIEIDARQLPIWLEPAAHARVTGSVVEAGFERAALDPRGYRRGALQEARPTPGGTGGRVRA